MGGRSFGIFSGGRISKRGKEPLLVALGIEKRLHLTQGVLGVVGAVLPFLGIGGEVVQLEDRLGGGSGERVLRDAVRFVPVVEPLVVVVELPELVGAVVAGRQRSRSTDSTCDGASTGVERLAREDVVLVDSPR